MVSETTQKWKKNLPSNKWPLVDSVLPHFAIHLNIWEIVGGSFSEMLSLPIYFTCALSGFRLFVNKQNEEAYMYTPTLERDKRVCESEATAGCTVSYL